MSISIRKAVRVLLINDQNQLLLMCLEDFDIGTADGKKNKRFWCTVGGGIEKGESIEEAVFREINEETGIDQSAIDLGPVVWHSNVELILKGKLTRLDESYIVARIKQQKVFMKHPTEDEQKCVKRLQWFSLQDIKETEEVIFPVLLPQYLPEILAGIYPEQPIDISVKKSA